MLAMVLNALWPLLAQAGPAQIDESLIEVCAVTGMKWIAVHGNEQLPEHKNLTPNCAFCALNADRVPLPSSPASAPIEVSIGLAVVAPGESASFVSQSSFSPALPRAPPVLS